MANGPCLGWHGHVVDARRAEGHRCRGLHRSSCPLMFVQKLPFVTLEWRGRQPILVRWIGFNLLPTAGSMWGCAMIAGASVSVVV